MERGEGRRNSRKKAMEKIDTSKEALHLHFGSRARHGMDGVNLGRERDDPGRVNDVTQVSDLLRSQHTLLPVEAEPSVRQTLQHFPQITQMLFHGGAGHQDVVQIHENAGHATKDAIH